MHAYPTGHQNPSSNRPLPHPAPPSVSQDAVPIPPGKKYPLAGAEQQYSDVLPLPLAGMFIRWAGHPDILDRGGDKATIYDLEGISGSGSEADEEEDKAQRRGVNKARTGKAVGQATQVVMGASL